MSRGPKQRIPCIIRISYLGVHFGEKSTHYTRVNTVISKIKITVNRHVDVSNIILKIEFVYANVKVIM